MSGGSFDYLCFKDASEVLTCEDTIQSMSDALAKLGYAEDVAAETEDLLLTIRAFENRINARLKRLSPVWKAVEWWYSCDWGEKSVKEAIEEYRQGDVKKESA